jgi:hypothetical protein
MRWIYKFPLRVRSLFRKSRLEQELTEELRFHLEKLAEEYVAKGMTPEEARYAAPRELGGVEQIKEECRDMRRVNWLENILQDVRYGLRQMRRSPGFAAVAVLMLALGIGANTAIFSLIDAVMLKMLPVKNPQQLVVLRWRQTKGVRGGPGVSGPRSSSLSYLGFKRLRRQNDIFSSVMGFVPLGISPESVTVNIDGQPSVAGGEMVSGNYFTGLGVSPVLGRVLTDADEDHAARVTVLGYGYWTRKFGRDPAVIGKTIALGGEPFSIVGVAPPEFFGVEPGRAPDFWIPLIDVPTLGPWGITSQSAFTEKGWWWLPIVGRLKPNVSQSQARSALDVWLRQTLTDEMGLTPADAGAFWAVLDPASRGLDYLRGRFSQRLLVLMGVVGLVLLIACANITGPSQGNRHAFGLRGFTRAPHSPTAYRELIAGGGRGNMRNGSGGLGSEDSPPPRVERTFTAAGSSPRPDRRRFRRRRFGAYWNPVWSCAGARLNTLESKPCPQRKREWRSRKPQRALAVGKIIGGRSGRPLVAAGSGCGTIRAHTHES